MTTDKTRRPGIPIEVLYLSGTPRQIGRTHGEICRDKIKEFIDVLKENVFARSKMQLEVKYMQNLVRKYWAFSVEYEPALAEEIEGIAEGSGTSLLDIFLLNSFLDLVSIRDDRLAATLLGCTVFGATRPTTEDSKTYIGQNYEMEAFYKRFRVLMEIRANNRPPALLYSYTGVIGCAGLNSLGIGLCINFLHPRDATFGVVYPFVVRNILNQERIGDSIGAATIGRRATGMNYLIADSAGHIFDVETSATNHDILLPENGFIAHANHYLSPNLRSYDLVLWDTSYDSPIFRRGSSFIRWYVAREFLNNNAGRINVQLLQQLACDHTNYPYSICCHGNPDDPDLLRGETNASMILDLTSRKLVVTMTHPCKKDFTSYQLS